MENSLQYLDAYRSSFMSPENAHGNLENILWEIIHRSRNVADLWVLYSRITRLEDIITHEWSRKVSLFTNSSNTNLLTEREQKVLTAIRILMGYNELYDIQISEENYHQLSQIIISFLQEDVINHLKNEKQPL